MTFTRPGAAHTPAGSVPNRAAKASAAAFAACSSFTRPSPSRCPWLGSGLVPLLARPSLRCSLGRPLHGCPWLGSGLVPLLARPSLRCSLGRHLHGCPWLGSGLVPLLARPS